MSGGDSWIPGCSSVLCCHEVERRGKTAEEEFIQVLAGCNLWRVPIFWDFRQEKVRNVPPKSSTIRHVECGNLWHLVPWFFLSNTVTIQLENLVFLCLFWMGLVGRLVIKCGWKIPQQKWRVEWEKNNKWRICQQAMFDYQRAYV